MRKIKKINGFLVVRFNDREKRNNPTLGSFGVIDAEQYTGDLDYDLDAFEYTDADLIEVAVEQARGLDAEVDYPDNGPVCTLVIEDGENTTEAVVLPQLLISGWKQQLEMQVKSSHYKDVDPRTAAHELYGYKVALCDLGFIDRDERAVDADTFGPACEPEEPLAYVCDELCKFREGRTQEELDAICERCELESWARGRAQEDASPYYPGKPGPGPYLAEGLTKQLQNLQALLQEVQDYAQTPPEEAPAQEPKPRTGFDHLPENIGYSLQTKRIYALGLALAEKCPDDDCMVYLNIFNMARELDAALDGMKGYPAELISTELIKRFRELGRMYYENSAIQNFKEGMKA